MADEVAEHVRVLREGDDASKAAAAEALHVLARNNANSVLIAAAGAIPPLVELLRDGSADAKRWAARALGCIAYYDDANKVLIAEAGAIPPLVELLRDGSADAKWWAAWALFSLARNNDANAVAVAVAIGFDAVVELARDGEVYFYDEDALVDYASPAAQREAARILLRECLPHAPDEIAAATATFLV